MILLGVLSIIALLQCQMIHQLYFGFELVSPDVYKVLFEDENMKVIEVEHEPVESDYFHGHHPMTWSAVQGGTLNRGYQ